MLSATLLRQVWRAIPPGAEFCAALRNAHPCFGAATPKSPVGAATTGGRRAATIRPTTAGVARRRACGRRRGSRVALRRAGRSRPATGRPALHDHQAARHRRHGRRLSGVRSRARRRRRDQGDPAGARSRTRPPRRDLEQRFKRELVLARQITHKYVVRIHDIGEIDGIKYLTMPFVEGRDAGASCCAATGKLPVRAR